MVRFGDGFTTITGETGAGKSILLGGLSLILGKRADLSALQDKNRKCIIEAEFALGKYGLRSFFRENELDYDANTIIRREILPGGKSRAFINDSPVNLDVLSKLGMRLIDIHSQHQTLQLTEHDFQLKVIDALADNQSILLTYRETYEKYQVAQRDLEQLLETQQNAIREFDYNTFLFNELEKAPLKIGLQEELEEEYEALNNVETLIEQLGKGQGLLANEPAGILSLLSELKQATGKIASLGAKFGKLDDRVRSIIIEVNDLSEELQDLHESVEPDPGQLEIINGKLQQLYDLRRKHGVDSIEELIAIKENLGQKINVTQDLDATISTKNEQLARYKLELESKAELLTKRRLQIIPQLIKKLEETLATLGMPNASFQINLNDARELGTTGKDELNFKFSANKGTDYGELKKVASGGELSRIMLTIKAILAKYEQLPTMMFDEIDTGVSGEISNKMGEIMHQMSKHMQIFSITHLAQVASKGDHHFKVYKEDDENTTHTKIKALNENERVVELAEMLGGKSISDAALAHAKELLN